MIKVNKGRVELNGGEAEIVAETMCLLKVLVKNALIPTWGSKENAKEKLNEMVEEVFENIEEED